MAVRVGDIDPAVSIHRDLQTVQAVEAGRATDAIRAATDATGASRGGDRTVRSNAPDGVIAGVRDENVAGAIHSHSRRLPELRFTGGPIVASERTRSGHGGNGSGGQVHFADAVLVEVGNDEVLAAMRACPERILGYVSSSHGFARRYGS